MRQHDAASRAKLARPALIRHGNAMPHRDSKLSKSSPDLSPTVRSLEDAILDVLTRAGSKTLSAPEIAHAIQQDGDWHGLLVPIRRAAVALAQSGRLIIYRKGKPVDPDDFRGVYRLGLPRHD